MAADPKEGRSNQRRRTRKDLLEAAARLMRQGRTPSFEEVAEEALVSRATAYRYFPGMDALLVEAAVDVAFPELGNLFDEAGEDPLARLERVDAAVEDMIRRNEAPLRIMLANAVARGARADGDGDLPIRQNRRTPLIEAALEPARGRFAPSGLDMLTRALALVIGTEAMVVFKDVLQLDGESARAVRLWAIRALVAAAGAEGPARG